LYYSRYFSVDDEVAFAYEYTDQTYLNIKSLKIVLLYKGVI
jgi:hypothetical protein